MARSRSFKPELLVDERLVACSMVARWLYVGIGTEADRAGRLEDRPLRLKLAVLPGDDMGAEPLLQELEQHGVILRYTVAGRRYIQIVDWDKLQSPHIKEPASTIPAPTLIGASTEPAPAEPVQARDKHQTSTLPAALTSDSGRLTLDPGPLTSDTTGPSSPSVPAADRPSDGAAAALKKSAPKTEPGKTAATWDAYAEAYRRRHGADPLRNKTVNAMLAKFVDQVGANDAPGLASYYVSSNEAIYVNQLHPLNLLLRDAQKLRTLFFTRRHAVVPVWANKQERSRHINLDQIDHSAGVGPDGKVIVEP